VLKLFSVFHPLPSRPLYMNSSIMSLFQRSGMLEWTLQYIGFRGMHLTFFYWVWYQYTLYLTLRLVLSINNSQKSDMKISKFFEVEISKISVIIVGYTLNKNFYSYHNFYSRILFSWKVIIICFLKVGTDPRLHYEGSGLFLLGGAVGWRNFFPSSFLGVLSCH